MIYFLGLLAVSLGVILVVIGLLARSVGEPEPD